MNDYRILPSKVTPIERLPYEDTWTGPTAEEFWATHCEDCAHDKHPMNVCSAVVGGDQNGPDYCPCALDYPALAAAYQATLTETAR